MSRSRIGRTTSGIEFELIDGRAPWEDSETRTPVVLQHGIGLSRRAWDPWVRRLAVDRRVVGIDLRGHAGSVAAWHDTAYPMTRFTDDVLDVMAACDIEVAHLVGESFGGTVCAALAIADGRRVASLTTCSTAWQGDWVRQVEHWPEVLATDEGFETWNAELTRARFDVERVPDSLVQWVMNAQRRTPPPAALGVLRCLLSVDLFTHAGELGVPLLNLVGRSPFVGEANAAKLANVVPQTENVFIPDSRHGIVLSHWRECCDAFRAFLARAERVIDAAG